MFCFCVEDMEYFNSEPCDDCAEATIKMEANDFIVPKAADHELADIDDNDAVRVKLQSECVTPDVPDQQLHDTGDCEILFVCLYMLLWDSVFTKVMFLLCHSEVRPLNCYPSTGFLVCDAKTDFIFQTNLKFTGLQYHQTQWCHPS